jgi:hypothetical protein
VSEILISKPFEMGVLSFTLGLCYVSRKKKMALSFSSLML